MDYYLQASANTTPAAESMDYYLQASPVRAQGRPAAKHLLKIRTITTGISLSKDQGIWHAQLSKAAAFNKAAKARFEADGFEVQTTRISTNSFEEWLEVALEEAALAALRTVDGYLEQLGVEMINLGPACSASGMALVPRFVGISPRFFASGVVGASDPQSARSAAAAVLQIAELGQRGEGNFQFCAAFNVQPGVPFFPAAYHTGPASFALGFENPELVAAALTEARGSLEAARSLLRTQMLEQMGPAENIALALATEHGIEYGGIDASIAPSPAATPLTEAFESLGLGRFGDSGTLAVCEMATSAIKALPLRLCGYSGLMLPPCEDAGLARRASEGSYAIHDLLHFSAVCGIGLDTVPVPGAITAETLAALYLDIAALAYRLNKPLSARLFPVPNKQAGEMTEFENPHLCNTTVFAVR